MNIIVYFSSKTQHSHWKKLKLITFFFMKKWETTLDIFFLRVKKRCYWNHSKCLFVCIITLVEVRCLITKTLSFSIWRLIVLLSKGTLFKYYLWLLWLIIVCLKISNSFTWKLPKWRKVFGSWSLQRTRIEEMEFLCPAIYSRSELKLQPSQDSNSLYKNTSLIFFFTKKESSTSEYTSWRFL